MYSAYWAVGGIWCIFFAVYFVVITYCILNLVVSLIIESYNIEDKNTNDEEAAAAAEDHQLKLTRTRSTSGGAEADGTETKMYKVKSKRRLSTDIVSQDLDMAALELEELKKLSAVLKDSGDTQMSDQLMNAVRTRRSKSGVVDKELDDEQVKPAITIQALTI